MTACCPQISIPFGLRDWPDAPISDAAYRIRKKLEESLDHYLEPKLELLLPEIESLLANGEQESVREETVIPVNRDTIRTAMLFASFLPRFGASPEVSADPDGDISFDWLGPSRKMFSVSINKFGRLAYAGWFGENSRVHGIEQLAESCPQEILRGIARATR